MCLAGCEHYRQVDIKQFNYTYVGRDLSMKELSWVGLKLTTLSSLGRVLYQSSYQDSSAGRALSLLYMQYNTTQHNTRQTLLSIIMTIILVNTGAMYSVLYYTLRFRFT